MLGDKAWFSYTVNGPRLQSAYSSSQRFWMFCGGKSNSFETKLGKKNISLCWFRAQGLLIDLSILVNEVHLNAQIVMLKQERAKLESTC